MKSKLLAISAATVLALGLLVGCENDDSHKATIRNKSSVSVSVTVSSFYGEDGTYRIDVGQKKEFANAVTIRERHPHRRIPVGTVVWRFFKAADKICAYVKCL